MSSFARQRGHDSDLRLNLVHPECRAVIDTLSLLLSHFLMLFVMFKVVNRPELNAEPTDSGRHFKAVGPRA